jgi:hypothetical protein
MTVTALDIEIAVANHFCYRRNLIVPNVSWGLGFRHELDLAIVSDNNYVTEVEIKTTKSDLKRDDKKKHGHYDNRIRRLYFAVPAAIADAAMEFAPMPAGVLVFAGTGVNCLRAAKIKRAAVPLTAAERLHLLHLSSMRVWTLKQTLRRRMK